MKNLTWQNPEQLFVAQDVKKYKLHWYCGIKEHKIIDNNFSDFIPRYKKKEKVCDYNDSYFENDSSNEVVTEYVPSYERPKQIKKHYRMVGENNSSVTSDNQPSEENQTLKIIIATIIGIVVVAAVIFLGFTVLAIPVFLGLILKKK